MKKSIWFGTNSRSSSIFILIATLIFSFLPANNSKADTGQNYFDLLMIPKGETKDHIFPFKQGEKYVVSVVDIQPQEKYTHSVKCTFRDTWIEATDQLGADFRWKVFSATSDANETISCKNSDTSRSNAAVVVRMTPFSIATTLESKDFAIPRKSLVIKKFQARKDALIGIAANQVKTKYSSYGSDVTGCELYDDKGKSLDSLTGSFSPSLELIYTNKLAKYLIICENRSNSDSLIQERIEFFDTTQSGKQVGRDLSMSPGSFKVFKFSAKKQQGVSVNISKTQMGTTVGADVKYDITDKTGKALKVNDPRSSQVPDKIRFSFIPDYSGDYFFTLSNYDQVDATIKFSGLSQLKEFKSSRIFPIN